MISGEMEGMCVHGSFGTIMCKDTAVISMSGTQACMKQVLSNAFQSTFYILLSFNVNIIVSFLTLVFCVLVIMEEKNYKQFSLHEKKLILK
jgi:ABC-type arginine transport system permease subunit